MRGMKYPGLGVGCLGEFLGPVLDDFQIGVHQRGGLAAPHRAKVHRLKVRQRQPAHFRQELHFGHVEEKPDAIVVGTGLGCIEDTEKFAASIIQNKEATLNPTPFILSTHNAIAAQVALIQKCTGYNYTYVHRGLSFESALLDSCLLLSEKSAETVLLGGADELTDISFDITRRLGHWKKEDIKSEGMLQSKSKGSIAGEGSAFFLLTQKAGVNCKARISGLSVYAGTRRKDDIEEEATRLFDQAGIQQSEVDLVLMGYSGDRHSDTIYHELAETFFSGNAVACFKPFCGEYQTATSFALYVASEIISNQLFPTIASVNKIQPTSIRNILIYNNYRNINHSLILLSKPQ